MVYKINKISRICLLFIFALFCITETRAQTEVTKDRKDQSYRPKFAIKFVPNAIINYTPGVQFGLEFATKKDQAINFELGYLSRFGSINQRFNGYRLVGEYRFYKRLTGKTTLLDEIFNRYIGVQLHFKQTFLSGSGTFGRADFAYFEMLDYQIVNTTQNALFIIGESLPLSDKWFLDLTFGAGIRVLNVKYKKLPEDARIVDNANDFFNIIKTQEGNYFYPKVRFSFKLVYIIK